MSYVDGFVLAVPKANKQACRKMAADPRMAEFKEMPFDAKRMIYGGFAPIFDAQA